MNIMFLVYAYEGPGSCMLDGRPVCVFDIRQPTCTMQHMPQPKYLHSIYDTYRYSSRLYTYLTTYHILQLIELPVRPEDRRW